MALFSLLTVLAAGVATADRIGVLLQDSDGSSGGYATTLKLSSGDWSVTGGVATVTVFGDAITVADTNDTTAYVGLWESATGSQSPKTDGGLTYNAGTGTLMATAFVGALTGDVTGTASLASGLTGTPNIDVAAIGATSINIGDGNFTVDSSGNALMRTASYIRDAENPFCTQYYSGTNYDDNYTEVCAPPEGFSETYRLYWPTAAPTGNQVLVFPAPTLGVSRGTWQNLAGGGDLVSTNNLSDLTDAETARSNLGLVIGTDVLAPNGSAALLTDFPTITEPIVNIALRGGGSAITTGSAGSKRIAAAVTITGYTIISSTSCSITVDLWRTTYTDYDGSDHPANEDSITASAPITLTTAVKAKDETLTGWTKTLSADDIIHVNVDSADCTGDVDIQVYGTRSL